MCGPLLILQNFLAQVQLFSHHPYYTAKKYPLMTLLTLKQRLLTAPKSLSSGILAVAWILFIYHTTVIIFNTNDDVGRSMRVHGYGYFVSDSPFILYSNFIWGWILSSLPKIGWMTPYYWMTIVILTVITWTFIYYLWQRLPWYLAISMAYIAVTYAIITPQFTINAGLLAVSMILALRSYRHTNRSIDLYLAICFGVLSLLIRERQFLLTSIIGLMFLPVRHLWCAIPARRAIILLFVFCISIVSTDRIIHATNPTYIRINQLRSAYDPIEDYKGLAYLQKNRHIIEQSGYSINDLRLISRYFWYNSNFTNRTKLEAINQQIDIVQYLNMTVRYGADAVYGLRDQFYLSYFIAIAALMLYTRSWRILLAVFCLIGMTWVFGASGRGTVTRVMLPLTVAIFVLALTEIRQRGLIRTRIPSTILVALMVTASMQGYYFTSQANLQEKIFQTNRAQLVHVDLTNTYAVGSALPITSMFPVNKYIPEYADLQILAFNLSVIEPGNVYHEKQRDFDGELTSSNGVFLIARDSEYPMIQEYCWSRFQGILDVVDVYAGDYFTLRNARCTNSPLPHRNNRYLSYGMIP